MNRCIFCNRPITLHPNIKRDIEFEWHAKCMIKHREEGTKELVQRLGKELEERKAQEVVLCEMRYAGNGKYERVEG